MYCKHLLSAVAILVSAAGASAATVTKVSLINGHQAGTGSTATGCASMEVDTVANRVSYRIVFSGLTGVETAAHFHGPAAIGASAGPVHTLPAGNPKVGVWAYPEAMEADILAGRIYINIHSTVAGGGEIRGQVVDMVAHLDGAQASVVTPGSGYGLCTVDRCANTLDYHIVYGGLNGAETVSHIHGFSLHGAGSGPMHALPLGSPKIGTWAYDQVDEERILAGHTYINVHSTFAGGGEVRGQITSTVAPLDGQQEVGAATGNGHGCGFVAIDTATNNLSYYLAHANMTGPATLAHIHGFAAPGANAGVLHTVGTANPAIGTWNYAAAQTPNILDGLTYFNVHTAANGGGELRGQIRFPAPVCPADTNCDYSVNVDDLVAVILAWGTASPGADIDGSGTVDVDDLVAVILAWGACER